MPPKVKDLTGKQIGVWTVIGFAYIKNRRSWWHCRCECGTIEICRNDNLAHPIRCRHVVEGRTVKPCTRCGKTKSLEEFNLAKNGPYGRQSWCKECKKTYLDSNPERKEAIKQAHNRRHREKKREYSRQWRVDNPDKMTAANRANYLKAPDKAKDNARRWNESNPDKSRTIKARYKAAKRNAPGTFTAKDIQAIFKAQNGLCVYCQTDLSVIGYSVDHIYPLSRGGSNSPDNLQLLCGSCNSSKKDKTHEEFITYLALTKAITSH